MLKYYKIGDNFSNSQTSTKDKIKNAKIMSSTRPFKYMAGQLSDIINRTLKTQDEKKAEAKEIEEKDEALENEQKGLNTTKPTCVNLKTPFTVKEERVTIKREQKGKSFMVGYGKTQTNYQTLSETLNGLQEFDEGFGHSNYKKLLSAIYDYINMRSDDNVKTVENFNDQVKAAPQELLTTLDIKDEERRQLSCLSAMLMISEPFRFQDQGRESRATIRRMYQNPKTKLIDSALTMRGAASLGKKLLNVDDNDENILSKKQISAEKQEEQKYAEALKNDEPYMSDNDSVDGSAYKPISENKEKNEITIINTTYNVNKDYGSSKSRKFDLRDRKDKYMKLEISDESRDDDELYEPSTDNESSESEQKEMEEIKEKPETTNDSDTNSHIMMMENTLSCNSYGRAMSFSPRQSTISLDTKTDIIDNRMSEEEAIFEKNESSTKDNRKHRNEKKPKKLKTTKKEKSKK